MLYLSEAHRCCLALVMITQSLSLHRQVCAQWSWDGKDHSLWACSHCIGAAAKHNGTRVLAHRLCLTAVYLTINHSLKITRCDVAIVQMIEFAWTKHGHSVLHYSRIGREKVLATSDIASLAPAAAKRLHRSFVAQILTCQNLSNIDSWKNSEASGLANHSPLWRWEMRSRDMDMWHMNSVFHGFSRSIEYFWKAFFSPAFNGYLYSLTYLTWMVMSWLMYSYRMHYENLCNETPIDWILLECQTWGEGKSHFFDNKDGYSLSTQYFLFCCALALFRLSLTGYHVLHWE